MASVRNSFVAHDGSGFDYGWRDYVYASLEAHTLVYSRRYFGLHHIIGRDSYVQKDGDHVNF